MPSIVIAQTEIQNGSKKKKQKKAIRVSHKLNTHQLAQLKKELSNYVKLDYEQFNKKVDLLDPEESDKRRLLNLFKVIKGTQAEIGDPEMLIENKDHKDHEDDIVIQNENLLLANLFRNIMLLLKSIHKQTYPEDDVDAKLNFRKDRLF
jgi:hypothetical protein